MTPPTPPPARSRQPQPPFDLCFMTPPTPPPARSRQPPPPFDLCFMVVLHDSSNTTTRTITPASTSFRFVLYYSTNTTTRTTTPTTSSFQFCFMTPHPPQTATPRQPPPPFGLGLINQAPTINDEILPPFLTFLGIINLCQAKSFLRFFRNALVPWVIIRKQISDFNQVLYA